jgi:hypothetical protein
LPDRQPRRQVDIRALEIQPVRDRAAVPADIGAEHPDLAGGRHDETEQHGDGRGLAGAIPAEQGNGRGRMEPEADVIDRGDRTIDLGEVAHRHRDARVGDVLSRDTRAGLFAETVNPLVHDLALLVRFVGIMARSPVLDFTYGCPRQ